MEYTGKTTCPHCRATHDSDTSINGDDSKPRPGDFSFCASCGEWAVFASVAGGLRLCNEAEAAMIEGSPDCAAIHQRWVEFINGVQGEQA